MQWSDFEATPIQTYDYNGTPANYISNHQVVIPANKSGYHVIAYEWNVLSPATQWVSVIDLNVLGDVSSCEGISDLTATNVTSNSGRLAWNNNQNCISDDEYLIYQDGSFLATTSRNEYYLTDLLPNTTYNFEVVEKSTSKSHKISFTTLEDFIATCQSPAYIHSMETTASSVNLMWNMNSDCQNYSSNYAVYQDDILISHTDKSSITVSGLASNTSYNFRVVDLRTNVSSFILVTTNDLSNCKPWNSRFGTKYRKHELVCYNGIKKEVLQDFIANGDVGWFDAESLFKVVD